jgi:pyruvate dehydrogenase E2 component (dihydrolipoamide acetyltransferase)
MDTSFQPNTAWRRATAAVYRKPLDAKIFGSVELDVTELEQWVRLQRSNGLKITLMHPLLLWVARGIRNEVPELNCYVTRGKIVPRKQVDALLSVLMKGDSEVGSLRIPQADTLTLQTLSTFMAENLKKNRKEDTDVSTRAKQRIAAIPWPFRRWVVDMLRTLVISWGVPLPGFKPDGFGSFVFSNIGSVGLDIGYPALLPSSNVSIVLIMGSVNTKPWVVDEAIVPRRILNLSAALDHRVVDGYHGGKLFRYLKFALNHPEALLAPPIDNAHQSAE